MDGSLLGGRRFPVRSRVIASAVLVAVLGGAAAMGGCAEPVVSDGVQPSADEPGTFDVASLAWDPSAVAARAPGLVGWQRSSATDPGALVALSPADGVITPLWTVPTDAGVTCVPLALDGSGQRMLLEVRSRDASGIPAPLLVMVGVDGAGRALDLPAGYEGVSSATFAGGRALVVASHATPSTFETSIGVFSGDGAWRTVPLEGRTPEYQFVEWVAAVPGTDVFAVLLKTPGGTGDRDDDALVLARFDSDVLTVQTDAFGDDSLPGASPLHGAEGVVYPRTWREVAGVPVVDLVIARWTGTAWEERIALDAGPIASGIETGHVVCQGADGTLWIRSAAEGANDPILLSLDSRGAKPRYTAAALGTIDWFGWIDGVTE